MDIYLHTNMSERQQINKNIGEGVLFSGTLRNESSAIKPSFLLEVSNPTVYNYCYIPDFGRYYFITDMVCIRYNLWRIECNVDVLMSFSNDILNLLVTVDRASITDEMYMTGDVFKTKVKTKTDIINFPAGLLDDGEYILITSGGVAS